MMEREFADVPGPSRIEDEVFVKKDMNNVTHSYTAQYAITRFG